MEFFNFDFFSFRFFEINNNKKKINIFFKITEKKCQDIHQKIIVQL